MYSKKQRIAAMIGIILLALLYVATFISSLLSFDGADKLFKACLFASVAMPILLWIYIALYGKMTNKKTIADMFPKDGENEEEVEGEEKKDE